MNTRSFAGRNKKSNSTQYSTSAAMSFRASQAQKRWQPKPTAKLLKSDKSAAASSPVGTSETMPLPQRSEDRTAATPPTTGAKNRSAASSRSRVEQAALLRRQALASAQQGDPATAIDLFNILLEQYPQSAIDYSNRGLVYFQSGQSERALADYDKAIELNPRLDSVYNNRANYYAAQGQYLEAILDYDIALDLNPANVRAWINQGITFRELEMYDRALESLDLALCLNRLEGHIYAERGRTYHLYGDWNCAIADYQRALAKLPQFTDSPSNAVVRLRIQVEGWMNELRNLTVEKDPEWKL
jgi:tetratricopeptide (TPR) repeat protein